MLKVKEEFIGKILKKGGITIVLSEQLKQSVLLFVESRFGDKFTERVIENKETENTETELNPENDYYKYDEFSLKELRELYPEIKAVSKKDFIDQIYDNN